MKKTIIIFVALLVLSLGSVGYAAASMTAAHDDVSFEEIWGFGDASYAEGLNVAFKARLGDNLLWDTEYTLGDVPKTDFTYSSRRVYNHTPYKYEPFYIYSDINEGVAESNSNLLTDEPESQYYGKGYYYEVASRTNDGQSRSETIDLHNYYDYLPISVNLSHGLGYFFAGGDGENTWLSSMPDEHILNMALTNTLKIELPEKALVDIAIEKDYSGNVTAISCKSDMSHSVKSSSIQTEEGIYFTAVLSHYDAEGFEIIDCQGLWLIPSKKEMGFDGEEYLTLKLDSIHKVFELNENADVYSLDLSEDGSCLNLTWIEQTKGCFLTVLDKATMTERQELCLIGADYGSIGFIFERVFQDDILFVNLSNNRFALAEKSDDNTYEVKLYGPRGRTTEGEGWGANVPAVAWDGEKLALAYPYSHYIRYDNPDRGVLGYSVETCGFIVEVYNSDGQMYKGAYMTSLDVLSATSGFYKVTRLTYESDLDIKWQ